MGGNGPYRLSLTEQGREWDHLFLKLFICVVYLKGTVTEGGTYKFSIHWFTASEGCWHCLICYATNLAPATLFSKDLFICLKQLQK